MQYAVPQFTDVEDKLIGPFTLKQFLFVVATGGIILFFYSILGLSLFFFGFAIPIGLLGLGLTFGKLNGRTIYSYIGSFISFLTRPQVRIFKRIEPEISTTSLQKSNKANLNLNSNQIEEQTGSRLKKLAYLLDQKTAEERELIDQKTGIR